jgi:uncharacterized membrane protein SpoIIM required for sporulation
VGIVSRSSNSITTTVDRFSESRSPGWRELETLVAQAGRRPDRLGPTKALRLGALYRSAAADLATARRRWPNDPATARLEALVGRARHLVYDSRPRRASLLRFVTRGYWRLIAERPKPLLVSLALLAGAASLGALWAVQDPGAALGVVPKQFRAATEPGHPWRDLSGGEQAAFTASIFTNNIWVTLVAFAGGLAAGIPTAAALLFNGLLVGVIGGLMVENGNGTGFVDLVTAHGVLELSCIAVAGAAGLRLGAAVVDPGHLPRRVSLQHEARRTVLIAAGTAPWLVVAGIVEGNRARLAEAGLGAVVGVGVALGAAYWGLVIWRGSSPRTSRSTSPADTP